MEHYTKWEPLPGIAAPCLEFDLFVAERFEVVLRFATERVVHPPAMRLTFGAGIRAFTSYGEFEHPWNYYAHAQLPKLEAPWAPCTFPLLIVHESPWFHTLVDERAGRGEFTHYRIVTMGDTLDILSHGTAIAAAWETKSAV